LSSATRARRWRRVRLAAVGPLRRGDDGDLARVGLEGAQREARAENDRDDRREAEKGQAQLAHRNQGSGHRAGDLALKLGRRQGGSTPAASLLHHIGDARVDRLSNRKASD
jgi:hypothetical protein